MPAGRDEVAQLRAEVRMLRAEREEDRARLTALAGRVEAIRVDWEEVFQAGVRAGQSAGLRVIRGGGQGGRTDGLARHPGVTLARTARLAGGTA